MAARLRGWDGDIQVQRCGVGDDHCMGTLIQRGIEVRLYGEDAEFIIGQGAVVCAVQMDVSLTEGDKIAQVTAPDRSKASYQEFHIL
jgi:hypothetical protein